MYLEAASWGLENMLQGKLHGYGYRFHMIGILAALRAVQHALLNHDRNLSPAHREAIRKWERTTSFEVPELAFIKYARDKILKEGSFESYATSSESGTGEGTSYVAYSHEYELAYYIEEKRLDLLAELRRAIAWNERELSKIEGDLESDC